MSPTQALHLPSLSQPLNKNYPQGNSFDNSNTSQINSSQLTAQNRQFSSINPTPNRPYSPSPLSIEAQMPESKYSFPNPTPPHETTSITFNNNSNSSSSSNDNNNNNSNNNSNNNNNSSNHSNSSNNSNKTSTELHAVNNINMSSSSPMTPSPQILSPSSDPFPGRSLAPLEPHHALPSYLTPQRRGSITDPSLHLSVPNPELARQYSQPDVNFPSSNSERRGSFVDNFPPSPSSLPRPSSIKNEQSFSPMETRKLRDSLPSLSASASPIRDGFPGPLMNPAFQAQFQHRRHSIAVGEALLPLKRKSSLNTTGISNHPLNPDDYPGKRRESLCDPNIQRLSLYDRRSSYSAPSSPPAQPQTSLTSPSSPLPKLNVQDVDTSLQAHADSMNQFGDLLVPELTTSNMPPSHLTEQGDPSLVYPPYNPRLSQIVQDEVSTPIITRRASMPVMTFPSRFSDPVTSDGSIPMDVDRYRAQATGYPTHQHSYHPYAYDYSGYIQPTTPVKETPYSRSPELRISHKLAERKRRKEMKELFDELRDSLPVDKSLKTSKWEILSKAVDFINTLKQNQDEMAKEVESLRQQLAAMKGVNSGSESNTSGTS